MAGIDTETRASEWWEHPPVIDSAFADQNSKRLLKSALAVSMKTPLGPPAPTATVQSPPEWAQPCCGVQFIPLICEKAPLSVSNSSDTVPQNCAAPAASSGDISMLAL